MIITYQDTSYFVINFDRKSTYTPIGRFPIEIKPEKTYLIRHPSKTPFKLPFKNHFFRLSYPYPRSGALTIAIVSAPLRG